MRKPLLLGCVLAAAGCLETRDPGNPTHPASHATTGIDEEEIGASSRPVWISNRLSPNCFWETGSLMTLLAEGPLSGKRLDDLGFQQNPCGLEVLDYLISCALGPGASVDASWGRSYSGAVGTASEWATGPLSEEGKRFTTACLAARVNGTGQKVDLSLRGPGLSRSETETTTYSQVEAAYFGNIFDRAPYVYACAGPAFGVLGSHSFVTRICGARKACRFSLVGVCEPVVEKAPFACGADLGPDGYRDCHTTEPPWTDAGTDRVITVFLKPLVKR